MKGFKNSLIYGALYLLPKNLLSCLMGHLVSMSLPRSWAVFINRSFARLAGINVQEAEKPLEDYANLQAFFIRKLKPGLRPIAPLEQAIVSPCDGFLSEAGLIKNGRLSAIKGQDYSLAALLDSSKLASSFMGGHFATIYLSPRDYHRFHAPLAGEVIETIYIPGSLWPVNRWAVANVKDLFCQNERIITLIKPFGSDKLLAHVAVGATMVGKIKLEYCSLESNVAKDKVTEHHRGVNLEKGAELGKFMFGSTIVLLFEPGLISALSKNAPSPVHMGEPIAMLQ